LSRGAGDGAADELCDLELLRQGMRLEPLLQAIGDFLGLPPAAAAWR
jgi:hypothetical protein